MDVTAQESRIVAIQREGVEEQREATEEVADPGVGIERVRRRDDHQPSGFDNPSHLAQECKLILDVLDDLDADSGVQAVVIERQPTVARDRLAFQPFVLEGRGDEVTGEQRLKNMNKNAYFNSLNDILE